MNPRDIYSSIIVLLVSICLLTPVYSQPVIGPSGETILNAGPVYSVAVSPDERLFATGGEFGVFLWDTDTGELIQRLYKKDHLVLGLAFTPDGSKLLALGNYCILWDVATGREILSFDCLMNVTDGFSISPDGKYALIGTCDEDCETFRVEMWNLETGTFVRAYGAYRTAISQAVFSPDIKYIAIGTIELTKNVGLKQESALDLWSAEEGEKLVTYAQSYYVFKSVSFSPDGNYLLAAEQSSHGTILRGYLWETLTGEYVRRVILSGSAQFAPDGNQIISISKGNIIGNDSVAIEYINPETGRAMERIECPGSGEYGYLLKDKRRVIVSNYGSIWDLSDEYPLRLGEQHFIGTNYGLMQLWDLETNKLICNYGNTIQSIYTAKFSPDGKTIGVGTASCAFLINVEDGSVVRTFSPLEGDAYFVSFSGDGDLSNPEENGRYFITSVYPNRFYLWDVKSADLIQSLTVLGRDDLSFDVTRDGTKILTGIAEDDNELGSIWDVETGDKIRSFINPPTGAGGNTLASVPPTDSSSSKMRPFCYIPIRSSSSSQILS